MGKKRLQIFTGCLLFVIIFACALTKWPKTNKINRHFQSPIHNTIASDNTNSEGVRATSSNNLTYLASSPKLIRFGADLEFDHTSQCPEDSLLYDSNRLKLLKPKTNRCPKLFIVGAKKGGTTSLYQYLSKHDDFQGIRLQESKWIGETFYFAQKYSSLRLSEYIKLFPTDKMTGDASVDNLLFCKSPERILKTCGFNTKIIILLRHPLKRYVSNFMMRVQRPVYTSYNNYTSISETTKNEYDILKKKLEQRGIELPQNNSNWIKYRCLFSCCTSMIYEGMYYVFVMNWLCNFPKENILFLNSEEMFTYPIDIYKTVLKFLGLKPLQEQKIGEITSLIYNKGIKPNKRQHHLNDNDTAMLNNIYKPLNDRLFQLLNWHNINWSL